MSSIAHTIPLRGGVQAPQYVFGTGGITKPAAIHHALSVGYRAFDTAQMYGNEKEVGEALRSYPGKVDRKDLFIITKSEAPGPTVEATFESIKASVEKIGLGGYVDLFLIHNPLGGPEGRKIQWLALEKAKKEGWTRAIGVSNFVVRHMELMKEYATELPAVNQIEVSPFNQEPEIKAYCIKEGIVIQAFATVVRGQKEGDPTITAIAEETGTSWNRVLLRWAWQTGHMITCKSETPSRISDNVNIFNFSLSDDQMARLDALECGFRVTPRTIENPDDRKRYYEDMP